jgi:hypothetical protein
MLKRNLEHDFIVLLKTLRPEDWGKIVNNGRTIKDVVAHMIGWEKEDTKIIRINWATKETPWFYKTDDYDVFNNKNIEYYKDYTPEQLIEEFEKYQNEVQKIVDDIGEDNLRKYPKLFGWLFRVDDGCHYAEHLKEIKDIINRT